MPAAGPAAVADTYLLFNIVQDPDERHDLSKSQPQILSSMIQELAKLQVGGTANASALSNHKGDLKESPNHIVFVGL